MSQAPHERSLGEFHSTVALPHASRGWARRLFAFAGPAYLVSVGYMDPGNWATDLAGGARFGYQLMWVPIVAILAATAYLLSRLAQRGNAAKAQSPDYDRREAD